MKPVEFFHAFTRLWEFSVTTRLFGDIGYSVVVDVDGGV